MILPAASSPLFHAISLLPLWFHIASRFVLLGALAGLAACGEMAKFPVEAGIGSKPVLPKPVKTIFPTINVATASGWPLGVMPLATPGMEVRAYASALDHPRWLYVLPNGDVLVAETNGPPRPEDGRGIKERIRKLFMKRAGAGTPSANRLTLLRGVAADGAAATRTVFLTGLNSPFGMALVGENLYVANTDGIVRFPYHDGDTHISGPGTKVADLSGGLLNHHWTKNVIASKDGKYLYASVGSNSNVAENGIEKEEGRAAIHEIDLATGRSRIFATGLRNPVGLGWEPQGGALWTTVNERDELGSDLVPDYMTSVKDGGFYGWPYSYYGQHVDDRVQPQRPDLVAKALVPDYALGSHTASLGLAFYEANLLPARYQGGAFIGQHGSWNRNPRSGYKVVFVPFEGGKPSGLAEDFLVGFLDPQGEALGRPVGVAVDKSGALLVADDVGNIVWRVAPQAK